MIPDLNNNNSNTNSNNKSSNYNILNNNKNSNSNGSAQSYMVLQQHSDHGPESGILSEIVHGQEDTQHSTILTFKEDTLDLDLHLRGDSVQLQLDSNNNFDNNNFEINNNNNAAHSNRLFSIGFLKEALSQINYTGRKPNRSYCTCVPNVVSTGTGAVSSNSSDFVSVSGTDNILLNSERLDNYKHLTHIQQEQHNKQQNKQQNVRKNGHKFTHTDMLSIAIVLCPLWFIANCCYNYALLYTSVASSTVISNLSGGFTLFFSWLYGIEKITYSKLLGLTICFVGVGMVAMADKNADENISVVDQSTTSSRSILGDSMAVFGAMGYGLYTTVLRVKVMDDESASMQLLLGYMGLVNALILSPILLFMVGHRIYCIFLIFFVNFSYAFC